jgi:hypothetical protein
MGYHYNGNRHFSACLLFPLFGSDVSMSALARYFQYIFKNVKTVNKKDLIYLPYVLSEK